MPASEYCQQICRRSLEGPQSNTKAKLTPLTHKKRSYLRDVRLSFNLFTGLLWLNSTVKMKQLLGVKIGLIGQTLWAVLWMNAFYLPCRGTYIFPHTSLG